MGHGILHSHRLLPAAPQGAALCSILSEELGIDSFFVRLSHCHCQAELHNNSPRLLRRQALYIVLGLYFFLVKASESMTGKIDATSRPRVLKEVSNMGKPN